MTSHPPWCDPAYCTVQGAVGLHRSRPSTIRLYGADPTTLDVCLWQGTALPGEHTDPYVELIISNDEGVLVEVDLDRGEVWQVSWTLRCLYDASGANGDHTSHRP